MATVNPYFSAHRTGYVSEQNLYENMICESIQISGLNVVYIPRTVSGAFDQIFGEDVLSSFESHAHIPAYLSDFDGYGGQSEFLSKFGMEIRDTCSFIIARRHFAENILPIVPVSRNDAVKWRPNEGDLIYVENTKSLFEIMFVEDEEPGFYQLNKKYVWTIRCELVRLNNEKMTTGHAEIDETFGVNLNRLDMSILTETGDHILTETGGYLIQEEYVVSKPYSDTRGYGDNDEIKRRFLEIIDFNDQNPFNDP